MRSIISTTCHLWCLRQLAPSSQGTFWGRESPFESLTAFSWHLRELSLELITICNHLAAAYLPARSSGFPWVSHWRLQYSKHGLIAGTPGVFLLRNGRWLDLLRRSVCRAQWSLLLLLSLSFVRQLRPLASWACKSLWNPWEKWSLTFQFRAGSE